MQKVDCKANDYKLYKQGEAGDHIGLKNPSPPGTATVDVIQNKTHP